MTPAIVMDTNVLVSAMRSRRGASFRLVGKIGSGAFDIDLSVPVAVEYEDVGTRILPQTDLTPEEFHDLLNYVCGSARHHEIHFAWRPLLPDPDDDMLLELAIAAGGSSIVTFNQRDFRGAEKFGIRVLTPQQFLSELPEA